MSLARPWLSTAAGPRAELTITAPDPGAPPYTGWSAPLSLLIFPISLRQRLRLPILKSFIEIKLTRILQFAQWNRQFNSFQYIHRVVQFPPESSTFITSQRNPKAAATTLILPISQSWASRGPVPLPTSVDVLSWVLYVYGVMYRVSSVSGFFYSWHCFQVSRL